MATLVLVHGGLWDDMDAERFWIGSGIVDALRSRGLDVVAPNRPSRAESWPAEAEYLAGVLPHGPVTLVAGSNGCSAAVALALSRPVLLDRLLLAWPPVAGDPEVDAATAEFLAGAGAAPLVIDRLLGGHTLRGFTDDQLAALPLPVAVLPPLVDSMFHRRATAEALLKVVPGAIELPATPEPPSPDFAAHLDRFSNAVNGFTLVA